MDPSSSYNPPLPEVDCCGVKVEVTTGPGEHGV